MEAKPRSARWFMLFLTWFVCLASCLSWYAFIPLRPEIMRDLGLEETEVSLIASMVLLGFAAFCIPGGIIADKLGTKRAIGIWSLLFAAFTFAKGATWGFVDWVIVNLLFGMAIACAFPGYPRAVEEWFPREELAFASGLYFTGFGLGLTLALAVTPTMVLPLLGSWRTCFYFWGTVALLASLAWWLGYRTGPYTAERSHEHGIPLKKAFMKVIKTKTLWLLVIAYSCSLAVFFEYSHDLPSELIARWESIMGLEEARVRASLVASSLTFGALVGNLVGPFISDRVGLRRPIIISCSALAAIFVYLGTVPGIEVVGAFLAGICMGSIYPIFLTIPLEASDIGHEITGSAVGILSSMANLSAAIFVAVGGIVAETFGTHMIAFYIGMLLLVISALMGVLLPETGRRHPTESKK
ncbi:MAG: MFS transporter [Candidatus Baldrarchaeia archaeon]